MRGRKKERGRGRGEKNTPPPRSLWLAPSPPLFEKSQHGAFASKLRAKRKSDSPLVAILKFAVSSWCEAWNRGIFEAARVSSYLTRQTIISSESFLTVLDHPIYLGSRGLFLESPGNFWGAESCFVFAAFTVEIKVSIILKIIKWNYQLTKQNWLIYGLWTVVLFNMFGF